MKTRLTDLRKHIIEILRQSNQPLTVRAIWEAFPKRPDLSTIYRALDYLESQGLVQAVTLSTEARVYFAGGKHVHFVVCQTCHEIQQFEQCVAESIQQIVAEQSRFQIQDHVLYFTGFCEDCQGTTSTGASA
jgi:Fur family transcriptional regulator, ferric uptake regulator